MADWVPDVKNDWVPDVKQDWIPDKTFLQKAQDINKGIGEGIITTVGGATSWIPQGLVAALETPDAIYNAATGNDAPNYTEAQKVGEKLAFQPETELGKDITSAVQYPFKKLEEGQKGAGEKTYEIAKEYVPDSVASAIAAGVETSIAAVPFIMGGVIGRGVKKTINLPSDIIKGAEQTNISKLRAEQAKQPFGTVPIKAEDVQIPSTTPAPVVIKPTIKEVNKAEPAPTSQEPIGITKSAKAALDINQKILEKGFNELPKDELAQYNTITKEGQKNLVGSLLTDENKLFEIAKSNEPMPAGVSPQYLFNVAKSLAEKKGDIDLMRDLAQSPIAEQRSVIAQRLGASAWENSPTDTVSRIMEVKKAREAQVVKPEIITREKVALKKETNNILLPKEELMWDNFLRKIAC